MADPITAACLAEGSFTLSAGTMEPAIVLGRLLEALSVLNAREHQRLTAAGGLHASIPAEALGDALSSWWNTDEAGAFLQTVIGAINHGAPKGYVCCYSALDRIELVRIDDGPPVDEDSGRERPAPPSVSVVRTRVRCDDL